MTEECCICFSKEGEDSNDELIKPCMCNSLKHRSCLNRWRSTGINSKTFNNCEVCKFKFIIEYIPESMNDYMKRIGQLCLIILFDLIKLFFTFLMISFVVGWFENWIDVFGTRHIRFFTYIPKILESGMFITMCYMSMFYIIYLFIVMNIGVPRIHFSQKPNGGEVAIYILLLLVISIGLSIYYIFNYIILYRCRQRVLYSKSKTQMIKDLK